MEHALALTGKLLIAMPGMGDHRFEKSVVLVCAHSEDGAMGIILNKPMQDARLRELIDQLLIPIGESFRNIPVHFGGPVEHGRGFVLHSADYESEISTLVVDADFALTATQDILEEFAQGRGPELAVMALGYAGWGPSQLEAEIGALALSPKVACVNDTRSRFILGRTTPRSGAPPRPSRCSRQSETPCPAPS